MSIHEMMAISLSFVAAGDRGTVYWEGGHLGQGGLVESVDDDTVVIINPNGDRCVIENADYFVREDAEQLAESFRVKGWDDYEEGNDRQHEDFPNEACEESYRIGWSNAVRYGNRNADMRRRYPDSPIAPSDFDPMDAGERWEDD